MKHLLTIASLLFTLSGFGQLLTNLGGQRAGVSALTFLKNDVSPRSMAMSGANLALSADGMSTAHNTALMAQAEDMHFMATDLLIGAGIHQSWLSGVVPLKASNSAIASTLIT